MLFKKSKKGSVVDAVGLHRHGVSFVRINHIKSQKPKVEIWEYLECPLEAQGDTVKLLAKQYHLDNSMVSTSLEPGEYRIVLTEAPRVPREEMREAVQWQVKDLIDFPLDEATIDVFDVPSSVNTQNQINVVAARKTVIKDKVDMLKAAKVPVKAIDIEELALRNLAKCVDPENKGAILFYITRNYGVILFVKGGELYFSRRLDRGTDALASSESALEMIALEIQRSVDYFDRHFSSVPISNLVVLPSVGIRESFIEFLDKNLSVKCSAANLAEGLEWSKDASNDAQSTLLISLGTALREEAA